MDFVSFHTHSTFSYGDGFASVSDHVARVSELGMSALALSEHGNVSSHVQLEKLCHASGIKPIFGLEAYFGPVSEAKRSQSKTHLTIFAMDDEGYHNLNQIVTQSWIDFYQKPTVSWESLVKHNAGLAVFTGCADSLASCTLLGGKFLGPRREPSDPAAAKQANLHRLLSRFRDVFGSRFYLECQRFPRLERTCAINESFAEIAEDTGIPLIGTADVHYPQPWQNVMQTALHAAHRGGTVETADAEWEYDILLTYPTSDEEIHGDLIKTGLSSDQATEAIQNTARLAEMCNVELPKAAPLRFPGVKWKNAIMCGGKNTAAKHVSDADKEQVRKAATELYMMAEIKKGWKYRCSQRPELRERSKEYGKRVAYEMETIREKDFMDYFLVTSDLVSYTKDQGKGVGPARGSAAGSLICYLLRITEIDPLYPVFNKMIFERFLDKTRSDPPDIDLDFDSEARPVIVGRALELYGNGHVANVGNHESYRGRSALDAMARAHNLPLSTFKPLKDRLPEGRTETDERQDDTIIDAIDRYGDNPEIAALLRNEITAKAIKLATWLEGNRKGLGIHAAGFVISSADTPITDTCAIYARESGTGRKRKAVTVIPYDKRDAEYLNLLKFDFLGLNTIGVVRRAAEMIGMSMEDMYTLLPPEGDLRDYDHSRPIIEAFMRNDLVGIFQFEGGTTRGVLNQVEPTEFRHLADINALSRPGPKYGGQTSRYVAVKHDPDKLELLHPLYDQHVTWTYGQIVYQEQIMFILRDLAGFPIEKVLRVRKIIGKKLGEHQFAELWADFESGCAANGIDSETALRVWRSMTSAAGYAFNTSHSYSYSWIAWQAMWLKVHYPSAFYASALWANGDGKEDRPRRTALLLDTKDFGRDIAILPLDPAVSERSWSAPDTQPGIDGGYIRPGFEQIPGIAEATSADIIKWRDEQQGVGWADLKAVKGIGKVTLAKMEAFAAQEDPFELTRVSKQLGAFRAELESGKYDNTPLPDADEFATSDALPSYDHCAWVGFVQNVVYRDIIEQERKKTGKSVDEIKAEMDDPDLDKKVVLFAYDEGGEVALRINRWRLKNLAPVVDAVQTDHHIVVAWGKVFNGSERSIQVKAMWILDPD